MSLAAFEADAWIEALIQNALRHTQPSTGIMLHLNRATAYAPCLIHRWNGSIGRLGVAAERVAVRWGRDAQSLRPALGDVPCLESAHPSPLSARRGFFGSRPFSRADALLREQGGEPVDWTLGASPE